MLNVYASVAAPSPFLSFQCYNIILDMTNTDDDFFFSFHIKLKILNLYFFI